jgi:hypothetical protein
MKKFLLAQILIFGIFLGFSRVAGLNQDLIRTTEEIENETTGEEFPTTSEDFEPTKDPNECQVSLEELCNMEESIRDIREDDRIFSSQIELLQKRVFTLEHQLFSQTGNFDTLVILLSLASMCIVIATFGILAYVMKLSNRVLKQEESLKALRNERNEKLDKFYGFY